MRDVNRQDKSCMNVNTFILDPYVELNTICSQKNQPVSSESTFKVVVCRHERKTQSSRCLYTGESITGKKLKVACRNGEPESFIGLGDPDTSHVVRG